MPGRFSIFMLLSFYVGVEHVIMRGKLAVIGFESDDDLVDSLMSVSSLKQLTVLVQDDKSEATVSLANALDSIYATHDVAITWIWPEDREYVRLLQTCEARLNNPHRLKGPKWIWNW